MWTTINNARTPRLTLSTELDHFWVDCVLADRPFEGTLIQGQLRLKDARTFFEKKLNELLLPLSNSERFERLRELHRRMTVGFVFLVYEVRSEAEVGVIFETLNERGRALTDLEKVKNYLLYLARVIPDDRSAQLAARINAAWSELFRNLAGLPDSVGDDLLRSHWLATQDADARKWKRTASVKELFPRDKYVPTSSRLVTKPSESPQVAAWVQLSRDVDAYVDSLKRCSYFQAEMGNPDAATFDHFSPSVASKVRDRMRSLVRTGFIAPYRSLLFAARLRYPEDGDFYADLLDLCERYSARVFIIVHWRSDSGASQLARIANDLYRSGDTACARSALIADLWWRASDTKVREILSSTSQDWYWGRNHTYFLYEYERSLVAAGGQIVSFEHFSLQGRDRTTEHILPQHPDDNARCWWDNFSPDQHQELVHSLGNLVLTWDNSSYSNHCFTDKRERPMEPNGCQPPCYLHGRMHQEQRLAERYSEWTPANIVSRQQELAEWALQRWTVEHPASQQLDNAAIDEGGGSAADEG